MDGRLQFFVVVHPELYADRDALQATLMQLSGVTLNATSQRHLYTARHNRYWTKS